MPFQGQGGAPPRTEQAKACDAIAGLKRAGLWDDTPEAQRAALLERCGRDAQPYRTSTGSDPGLRPAWSPADQARFELWRAEERPWTPADEARLAAVAPRIQEGDAAVADVSKALHAVGVGGFFDWFVSTTRSLSPHYVDTLEQIDRALYETSDGKGAALWNRPEAASSSAPSSPTSPSSPSTTPPATSPATDTTPRWMVGAAAGTILGAMAAGPAGAVLGALMGGLLGNASTAAK